MMAQLQSLKELKDIHEKTIIKQLEILQSAPVAPSNTPEVLLIQTETAPTPKISKTETTHPTQKISSPNLNPLALKLTESKSLTEQQQAFIQKLEIVYNQRTARSKAYSQNSRKTMVDVKPTIDFRMALKEFQYPIVSESAQGAYFRDIDGNDYIDLAMGF